MKENVAENSDKKKTGRRKKYVARGNGSHWLRSWRSKIVSPKVWQLSPEQYRTWDFLLCMTDVRGYLPRIDYVAHHLRLTTPEAERRVHELVELQFIDPEYVDGRCIYRMHDWEQWQPSVDQSTARVRAHRNRRETEMKRKCNASCSVSDVPKVRKGTSFQNARCGETQSNLGQEKEVCSEEDLA